jgi:hypothetical protein
MNYRQHYFLLNASGIIGAVIGLIVWLVESSIRMFSAGVAKMPFESISWRMYVYPVIGGALVWLLVRFLLMARCESCQAKLRFIKTGSPQYICPGCGARFEAGGGAVEEQPHPADQLTTDERGVRGDLRQRLYPQSAGGTAAWKVALTVLGVLAVLSVCIPVKGTDIEVYVAGIQVKTKWAALGAWIAWTIMNFYILIGIIWNLAAPEDQPTANLSLARRGLFMTLGIVCVTISVLVPVLR